MLPLKTKAHNRENGQKHLALSTNADSIYNLRPSNSTPRHLPKRMMYVCTCALRMCVYTRVQALKRSQFTAALFAVTFNWKLPKCLCSSTADQVCKLCYKPQMNTKQGQWSTATQENHKRNVNDRSQTHKHIYCDTPFTGSTKPGQATWCYWSGLPWSGLLAGSRGGSQEAGGVLFLELRGSTQLCSVCQSSSSVHLRCIHFLHICSSIKS